MSVSIEQQELSVSKPLVDGLLVYLRILKQSLTRDDLVAGLPAFAGDIPIEYVPRAINRFGLVSRVLSIKRVDASKLPALIGLNDGRFVTVIGRRDDQFVVVDDTVPNGEYCIAIDELNHQYSGTLIVARADISDLQRRYTGLSYRNHWFWGRFLYQKTLLIDIVVGSLVANILAVAVSLFALQVYDRVIPNQSTNTLWVLAMGCFVAIIFESLLRLSRSYLMDVSGKKIELELSTFLFQRLTGMRLSGRPESPGSMVYAMREFSSVREFFTAASIGSVADIPFVFIFLALIYAIAGPVVGIVMVAMVLIVLPSLLCQGTMARLSREALGGASASGKLLTQMVYGQETVKTCRAERLFLHQWEEINTLNAAKTTQQRSLAAALTYWSTAVQQVAYIACVIAGVYLIFDGQFTVGTVIAVSILSSRTLSPITQLSGTIARWQQVRCALQGLEAIADSVQERPQERKFVRKPVLHGSLSLRQVQFAYQTDEPVRLELGDLEIVSGETVAVLGENGSGKSTLLKLLSGIYDFTSGNYTVDGLDVRQIDPEDLRRNIGYLPQESRVFSGTLRDNLTFGEFEADESRLFDALEFAGLHKMIASHPLGLDLPISDGGEGISVGQKQSLSLARLYLQDPRVVLLDEPTASLDQNVETSFVNCLKTWLEGRTCVVATHRVPILSLATRIVVLKEGRIAMDGPRETVLRQLMSGN